MAFEFEQGEGIDGAAARIACEQLAAARAWLVVAAGGPSLPSHDRGDQTHASDVPPVADVDTGDIDNGASPDDGGTEAEFRGALADYVASEVDDDAPVEVAVHEARKCCKRIRGLVRLLRPGMEHDYRDINRLTRDAARELSGIRDAHALLETFDVLVATHADQVPDGGVNEIRRALASRADQASQDVSSNRDRVTRADELLCRASDAVTSWHLAGLDSNGLDEAVVGGVAKTAARGRDRFEEVAELDGHPSDELLHQWRKRVKYSWYHVSLLEPAAPSLLGAHADALHDLADVLGDDHDLAVLAQDLRDAPDEFGGTARVRPMLVIVEGVRRDLQRRAVALGARIHAEDPDALGRRLVALHAAARRHGPELSAGEIDDLFDVADGLGDRTNGELRELARAHDIPGRSRLDRTGLLAVLRAVGAAGKVD